jgi:hypothetical protein
MAKISALLLLCLLLSPAPVHAQSDFSTLPIRTGDIVHVKEASGTEVSGPVVNLSPASLSIAGQDFTPANTLQIDRRGDSLKKWRVDRCGGAWWMVRRRMRTGREQRHSTRSGSRSQCRLGCSVRRAHRLEPHGSNDDFPCLAVSQTPPERRAESQGI